ncbi:MAG: sugar-binding protein [Verrucomicrobiaceae bacterium]
MKSSYLLKSILLAATAFTLGACGKSPDASSGPTAAKAGSKPKIAYVTNGIDPFWNNAAVGVRAGEKEFNASCEVLMPPKGIVDQKRMVETLLAQGIEGIAISPIDAANQVGLINEAASRTNVITHDSDAPDSKRLCFVGMNNYNAGRAAGKLVKEAVPAGGQIMLFVGRLEQLNAQQRRQGVIDELFDKPMQELAKMSFDPSGKPLTGGKFTVLDTRTDNFDYSRAKSNAEDAINSNADLACMVGLFAYNIPNCLTAVKEAGKLGKIKMVGFDEQDATLDGIEAGNVYGTVSQQPYQYGYHSVRILAALARGDKSVLPASGFLEVPIIEVRKENIQKFREELKKLQAAGQ